MEVICIECMHYDEVNILYIQPIHWDDGVSCEGCIYLVPRIKTHAERIINLTNYNVVQSSLHINNRGYTYASGPLLFKVYSSNRRSYFGRIAELT
jgi:hypothetical protein